MEKSSFPWQRRELKYQLLYERGEITEYGYRPICPICNKPIAPWHGIDMHEVLITRGDARGLSDDFYSIIFVAQNCVLVHHGRCHKRAASAEGKRNCIKNLLSYEGYKLINEWLSLMETAMNSEEATQEKLLLEEVYNDYVR